MTDTQANWIEDELKNTDISKRKARMKEYYPKYAEKNKTMLKMKAKEYYNNNKESLIKKQRLYILKRKYNLTYEQFQKLLESQNNCCEICKRQFGKNLKSNIDHNHNTNKTRGLLCFPCNSLIGNCKEDVSLLNNAINYLTKYNGGVKQW
jgi:superfamily II helicase